MNDSWETLAGDHLGFTLIEIDKLRCYTWALACTRLLPFPKIFYMVYINYIYIVYCRYGNTQYL
jgi:hypothetical protein